MLPPARRIHRGDEFGLVVRRGRRAASPTLVVHLLRPPSSAALPQADGCARAGFVVSKAVGGSVVRHQVVRRLRALVAARLDPLPCGTLVVVRALPAAASARSSQLGHDLDQALTRLLGEDAA